MMTVIRRIFVEKKPEFAADASHLLHDLKNILGISPLEQARIIVRYDVEGLPDADYRAALWTVFAEPPLDMIYEEEFSVGPLEFLLAVEYLPGQYDQRADSAAQCLKLISPAVSPTVVCSKVFVLKGALTPEHIDKIKKYLINPVDSREATLAKPSTLNPTLPKPGAVPVITGFTSADDVGLQAIQSAHGMAMTLADLRHTQAHFRDTEKRDPTETELKMLDTYWSDHCRHTTFLTELTEINIKDGPLTAPIHKALEQYRQARAHVFGDSVKEKPECLMDMALLPARYFRSAGKLDDQEVSSEINACSLIVDVDNTAAPGGSEPWLLMFKNETHNHPTEIEPFGGAATCLGGAIRDPLSGRAYVYQSMRVTGSGDPRVPVEQTLPGKLPQRKITQEAARGFSAYGNQIGLTTGQVTEIYDDGYIAKRMEIGAVVGAAPMVQVRREEPVPGDLVILVGGRTGRDGIGGATGSSKSHTETSIKQCGAEVQKGDPPMERKLQRLFRKTEFARLVKKCNDFGAGGVSVAICELADGLRINLDVIPKKYEGLNGTELAIAESQERMAVVIAPNNLPTFLSCVDQENLEATVVAEVTEAKRLVMTWRDTTIVDLSREFLDTNGAPSFSKAEITAPDPLKSPFSQLSPKESTDLKTAWLSRLAELNTCSQRGLVERFDSTIGAASLTVPFGGKRRRTPTESMAAKFPVMCGETHAASAMSHAFFPALSRWSPFHGAVWAHVAAAAKLVATGADHRKLRFTLQEYFCKPQGEPERWGLPTAALLGAFYAQMKMETPAIGGKDSMSGSFKDLDVPPTLVAFAVGVVKADEIATPEFKKPGNSLVLIDLPRDSEDLPDWVSLRSIYSRIADLVRGQKVCAIHTVGMDGLASALSKMAFGNAIGIDLTGHDAEFWLAPRPGSFVLETEPVSDLRLPDVILGKTITDPVIKVNGHEISLAEAERAWEDTLEPIFPTTNGQQPDPIPPFAPFRAPASKASSLRAALPRVLLTVFPGTNCEYDTAAAFEKAGATVETLVFRNLTQKAIDESLEAMAKAISKANIVVIPGGFSAGDEPEGSGKFIAAAYRAPSVRNAIHELLHARDGLMIGICNGFQALIKLGLVPYGEIKEQRSYDPTLTFNSLRYTSRMAWTRVVSNASPWLSNVEPGDIHTVAIAHGEGRIVGPDNALRELLAKGQVATQYVDDSGQPSMDLDYNPNGSALAIEGLFSPDGRVFGKMAHAERYSPHVWQNAPGNKDMGIFKSGVEYFTAN
ncbi:MAG: phosphoribosylformylglycinamidine synthase [Holophagales bacterium]|jgi:phosphoribosylformylglycinamidine synthase|nr:phosphoribosylformylglycinamidine synthase [Holophagales bacterium]